MCAILFPRWAHIRMQCIDTGFCKIVVAKVIWLTTELWTLNPLLEVSKLSGFKMSTNGANANHNYLLSLPRSNLSLQWICRSPEAQQWPAVDVGFSPHWLSLPLRPMAYHSHQMKSSRNVSKSTTRLGGEDVPALQHRCMRRLLNRNDEMLPEWLLWHWRPTRIWVLCKKLKETFWWKEKEHYGALRNEPKMSPLSLTRLLGQVNASKSQSWKTKEHVWKHFIKSLSQNMEGNTADHNTAYGQRSLT